MADSLPSPSEQEQGVQRLQKLILGLVSLQTNPLVSYRTNTFGVVTDQDKKA